MNIPGIDAMASLMKQAEQQRRGDQEVRRLGRAAEQFEALVLERLLKEMRTSVPGGDDASDPASGTLDDFGATALAGVMSKSGGFGLAEALVTAMETQVRALAAQNEGGGPTP